MNYRILLCFTLGFGMMSHFVQGMSPEQAQKIVQEMINPALLPSRAASEILLKAYLPDFLDGEGNGMLNKIYSTPNIDNGTVGTVIAQASMDYAARKNRAVPALNAFQGEDIYAWIENFLIKRDEDKIFTLPNKDEFLSGLNRIESHFKEHFGNLLVEHLSADGMTVKRAKMIVKAAITLQMRNLASANMPMVALYRMMKYPEKIEKFILGDA